MSLPQIVLIMPFLIASAGAKDLRALFSWDLLVHSRINIPVIVLATTSHMIMLTVHQDKNGWPYGFHLLTLLLKSQQNVILKLVT